MHFISEDERRDSFAISGGTTHVLKNKMLILADTAERSIEIDVNRAEQSKSRAESRLASSDSVDIDRARISMAACVTSYTRSGFPAIGYTASPSIAVLTGGCGAAAKSSDEIGRLGAELLVEGQIIDTGYEADFAPVFSA